MAAALASICCLNSLKASASTDFSKKYSLRASGLKKLLPPRPALIQRIGIACAPASAVTLQGFIIGAGADAGAAAADPCAAGAAAVPGA